MQSAIDSESPCDDFKGGGGVSWLMVRRLELHGAALEEYCYYNKVEYSSSS